MQGREIWQKIIYGIIVGALFAALFLVSFRPRESFTDRQPVSIVIFGDSIFGEIRDEEAVPARLEEILGKSVYNGAFGGTCAARVEPERRLDYARDVFSLAELAKSAEAGDFGVQQSVSMRESNTEYFGDVIDGLDAIDFSGVEIIVIQQGLNDYHAGVPIENPDEPYDERTFMGAVRSAVRSFRRVNPQARIVMITPVYTWYIVSGKTCAKVDSRILRGIQGRQRGRLLYGIEKAKSAFCLPHQSRDPMAHAPCRRYSIRYIPGSDKEVYRMRKAAVLCAS